MEEEWAKLKTDIVLGIIYSKFDEKIGPTPVSWTPSDLSEKIRNRISFKSINTLSGEYGSIPKTLVVLPFPTFNMKGLIKYFQKEDTKFRGRTNDRTITVIFAEVHDVIYYKYMSHFEQIFDDTYRKLLELDTKDQTKIQDVLKLFQAEMLDLLQELCKLEFPKYHPPTPFPREQSQKTDSLLYRRKVVIIGEEQVGKTSFILRFTDKAFRRTYIPTIGVNISEKSIKVNDETMIEFILWDIAGRSKFEMMRKNYYLGADAVLFTFDLTNRRSFQQMSDWYDDISFFLGSAIKGVLLGNKNDLRDQRKIFDDEILKFAENLNLKYFPTSALTGLNVEEVFFYLSSLLTDLSSQ